MKVLLTGSGGMLGMAILRVAREAAPDMEFVTSRSADCDLTDQLAVKKIFDAHGFDAVIHCAAKVGGIQANVDNPVEFMAENLAMNNNVILSALLQNVPKFLFLGSSCMYPKDYKNPLKEEYLLAAPLEPTNEGYALAKIVGAKLCEYIATSKNLAYRTLIPCNLYGPDDDFSPEKSHLIPAIIRKLHEAKENGSKEVEIWGDGTAAREFMYVDDLASFIVSSLKKLEDLPLYLNIGIGDDHTVNDYYSVAAQVIGYEGEFIHDLSRPTGMMRKLVDISLAQKHGWKARTSLKDGLRKTVDYYVENYT